MTGDASRTLQRRGVQTFPHLRDPRPTSNSVSEEKDDEITRPPNESGSGTKDESRVTITCKRPTEKQPLILLNSSRKHFMRRTPGF